MASLSAHISLPEYQLCGFRSRYLRSSHSQSWLHTRVSVGRRGHRIKAFFNPIDEPIVKEALKEPIAFFGGVFAGLLRLDLKEDPLREWVARTAEAAGLNKEQDTQPQPQEEESPQQIEIE
eukprot:Gb_33479 [translate_table: standard]